MADREWFAIEYFTNVDLVRQLVLKARKKNKVIDRTLLPIATAWCVFILAFWERIAHVKWGIGVVAVLCV